MFLCYAILGEASYRDLKLNIIGYKVIHIMDFLQLMYTTLVSKFAIKILYFNAVSNIGVHNNGQ